MSLTSYRAAPPRGGVGLWWFVCWLVSGLGRPGGDLLSRVLRRSTIGAEGFHGRVRDGIGCLAPRHDHQVDEDQRTVGGRQSTEKGNLSTVVCLLSSAEKKVLVMPVRLCVAAGGDQADRAISTG